MQDDEYELMPKTELEYLRREVEKLKRNPLGDTQASITLLESINKLNANITHLNEILTSANDDMVRSFNNSDLQSQMVKMAEQQEKLARGIVAVAELVKKIESERSTPLPSIDTIVRPMQSVQPVSPMSGPALPPLPEVAQQRNPFDDGRQQFNPIMNEPLPRPAPAPQMNSGPNPFIPQEDIPPPPPRRR